jgi:hypothetical protein
VNRARQHWLAVCAALLVVLASTVAAESRMHGTGTKQAAPVPAPIIAVTAPPSRELQFGLDYSDTLPYETTAQLDRSLNDANGVGAQWIRVDLGWQDYQPFAALPPDFTRFDKVVGAARARGLKILATLGYPPPWARESSCASTSACPPTSAAAFARFAGEVAARYAPEGLHDWEVWNEPNIGAWAPSPDPVAYSRLLTATAAALRAADSQAFVMLGGLAASRPGPGLPYMSPYDFISAVGHRGALKSVDAVAYHPYPPTKGAIAASASFRAISSAPKNIVEALSEQGAGKLPVWITETGADIPELVRPAPDQVTVQAETLAQSSVAAGLVPVLGANQHVAVMFWFSEKDGPAAPLHFGLRDNAGNLRASFTSLRQAIAAYKNSFTTTK